jgi:hypothetical protein
MKKVIVMVVIMLILFGGVASAQLIFVGKSRHGSRFYLISGSIEGNTGTVVDVLSYEELAALNASGAPVRFINILVLRVECLSSDKGRIIELGYADGDGRVLYREPMDRLMIFDPESPMRKACELILNKR